MNINNKTNGKLILGVSSILLVCFCTYLYIKFTSPPYYYPNSQPVSQVETKHVLKPYVSSFSSNIGFAKYEDGDCHGTVGFGVGEIVANIEGRLGVRVKSTQGFPKGVVINLADGANLVVWDKEIDCKDPPFDPTYQDGRGQFSANPDLPKDELWIGNVNGAGSNECELASTGDIKTTPYIPIKQGTAFLVEESMEPPVVVLKSTRKDNGQEMRIVFATSLEVCEQMRKGIGSSASLPGQNKGD